MRTMARESDVDHQLLKALHDLVRVMPHLPLPLPLLQVVAHTRVDMWWETAGIAVAKSQKLKLGTP